MKQRLSPARVENIRLRSRIISLTRHFFDQRGFLSVETPSRIPSPVPELHIDTIRSEGWFLQPSPEICMKRLLCDGIPEIYQITNCWRNGERGRFHLPEFTMLEWYRADSDYNALMDDTLSLLHFIARALNSCDVIKYKGKQIRVDSDCHKITVSEAFEKYAGITAEEAIQKDIFDELMVEKIEPLLGLDAPSILYDYPKVRASLARTKKDNPDIAERFEIYVAGIELANGFSELNEPVEQRDRFESEERLRRESGKPPYNIPEKFLQELAEMPESAGIALGVDRLVMLFCDADNIDDVVAFTPEEL